MLLLNFICIVYFSILPFANGLLEGIYCGKRDCYDVLGVTREATKAEIAKSYRQLARKHHPDVHRTKEAKEEAEEIFRSIATAYEILRDDDSRKDYDYMLDHPDEIYRHYYQYYRHRYSPKVDVRIVIVVTITIISIIQYLSAIQRYNSAISYLMTVPKYKIQAMQLAKDEGLLEDMKRKGQKGKPKEERKGEEEKILRKIVEDKMDIKGGYAKPSLRNVLWVQIIFLPYTIGNKIWWEVRWIYKFTISKQELGKEEKLYKIRKYLGLTQTQFDSLEVNVHEDYLKKELWVQDKFNKWKKDQEEERRIELSQNSRYKSYRRYMKNHGPGQITFDD